MKHGKRGSRIMTERGYLCRGDDVEEGWRGMLHFRARNRVTIRRVDKAKVGFYTSMYEGMRELFFPSNRQTIIMQSLESVGWLLHFG